MNKRTHFFVTRPFTRCLCLTLCLMLLFLSACSHAKDTETDQQNEQNDTLIYAGESVTTINPVLNTHDEIVDLIFSGLLKYDGTGQPIEDLAESYSYDRTEMTYTFLLRSGVTWHDGTPFTAADVVFTYRLLMEDSTLAGSLRDNYQDIASVSAADDHTVVFTMKAYNANMPGYFTIGILPAHLLEGEDLTTSSFNQNPIGTGRYAFSDWDRTQGTITLVCNEQYYGTVPSIKQILYKTVSEESTKATMLASGEADLAWLNASYADTFREKDGFTNWDFDTADYRGVSMDMSCTFWKENGDSIAVLNYAIDKNAIINGVLKGQGTLAYSPIQMNALGTNYEADCYYYDTTRFAEEMTQLGWEMGSDGIYCRNGVRFHFTVQVREYEEERVSLATVVSSMLASVGVEMEVICVTSFDFSGAYDGFLSGYAAPFDPDTVYGQFVTGGSENTMHYSNAQIDEILTLARHTEEPEKRLALYGDFEVEYARNPGILLIAYLKGNYVSTDRLTGPDITRILGHHAAGIFWNMEEWTI